MVVTFSNGRIEFFLLRIFVPNRLGVITKERKKKHKNEEK